MTFTYSDRYKFNESWFDPMIPVWHEFFSKYNSHENSNQITNVLEIGCYEGRATVWLCENVLTDNTAKYEYDVVDTFGGSLEEDGMKNTKDRFNNDNNFIENNFRHNISFFNNIKFNIYKGLSSKILPTLKTEYDFIYIDASHHTDDTFVDAYYASKLLKKNGIIIFDDYLWGDPSRHGINTTPKAGIDFFYKLYKDLYHIVYSGYQIILIKK